jgi:hypothetical protein
VVYTTVRRIPLFSTPTAFGWDDVFLGAASGSWYSYDDIGCNCFFWTLDLPCMADVVSVVSAPFGFLLGWGLNDPWV